MFRLVGESRPEGDGRLRRRKRPYSRRSHPPPPRPACLRQAACRRAGRFPKLSPVTHRRIFRMTTRTARRKRIIRVRSVEHQMAEANLARANGELANLVELAKRLETLRVDLAMAKGAVAGRELNTIGELAMRLDMAKENLTAPLDRASAHRRSEEHTSELQSL